MRELHELAVVPVGGVDPATRSGLHDGVRALLEQTEAVVSAGAATVVRFD
jgi:hypothetical protein